MGLNAKDFYYPPNAHLKQLFLEKIEKNHFTLKELAKKFNYNNINKGMRKIPAMLNLRTPQLHPGIFSALDISEQEFKDAVFRDKTIYLENVRKDQEETAYLAKNFRLIIENMDKIIENERYYFCILKNSKFAVSFIFGASWIPLGTLCELWKENLLIEKCPICGDKLYLIASQGSCLSGINSSIGFCIKCYSCLTIQAGKFIDKIVRPLINKIKKWKNRIPEAIPWKQLIKELRGDRIDEKTELVAPSDLKGQGGFFVKGRQIIIPDEKIEFVNSNQNFH